MAQDSNALIKLLLVAEEEADKIVRNARDYRAVKLKSAVKAAQDEIELFKKQEQEYFESELKQRIGATDTSGTDLESRIKKDLEHAQQDYKRHKNEVISFLMDAITKVDLKLEPVQKRMVMESLDLTD